MVLKDLTDRDAVLDAVRLCDRLGSEEFLQRHGFSRARGYLLEVDGKHYDPKVIAGVAYGVQYPDRRPLAADQFSDSPSDVAERLRQLDFAVVTRAQLAPPRLGEDYPRRTAISDVFGGNNVAGITRFPGDLTVNAFSDEQGPYADEPPHPVEPFEYRGDGRRGHQTLTRGNLLLDTARQQHQAVRFWYRPAGGSFTFVTWVAVLDRAQAWARDDAGEQRLEYTFLIMAVPGPEAETWPSQVQARLNDGPIVDAPPPLPLGDATACTQSDRARSYRDYLNSLGDEPAEQPAPTTASRNNYQRSRKARDAVLLRAANRCEHDGCTGMPPDTTATGAAILEVDHVEGLARSGLDYPRHMIALCPNCHAAKTRGRNRGALTRHLRILAAKLHQDALANADTSS